MTCYDSQYIQRLTAIRLDSCGRIPLDADDPTPALKGLKKGIQTLTRTRQMDVPTQTVVKTVDGGTCQKPRPNPTDRGFSYGLSFCGQNPLFEVLAGYKTLDLSGADIVGWEDVIISTLPKLALEVIFTPSADACAVGEAPQCIAVIIPMLEQWVRSGDEAFNGEATPDLVMTGQTAKSSNLFQNFTAGTLPGYLAHWQAKFDDIATGRAWAYTRLIDCPILDPSEDGCVLAALTAPVS
jgi:hypothetical protein